MPGPEVDEQPGVGEFIAVSIERVVLENIGEPPAASG